MSQVPVKWTAQSFLKDRQTTLHKIPVVPLEEVREWLKRLDEDMLAAGFDAPTEAYRLLAHLDAEQQHHTLAQQAQELESAHELNRISAVALSEKEQEVERVQKELDHHVRQRCYATEENLKLKQEVERLKSLADSQEFRAEQAESKLATLQAALAEREAAIKELEHEAMQEGEQFRRFAQEIITPTMRVADTGPISFGKLKEVVEAAIHAARQDAARLREAAHNLTCAVCKMDMQKALKGA